MDIWTLLGAWYTHWLHLTLTDHLANMLGGVIGASMYATWSNPVIKLPHFDRHAGEIKLNFFGLLLIGAVFGLIVDVSFVLGVIAGAVATPLFGLLINRLIPGVTEIVLAAIRIAAKVDDVDDKEREGK